MNEIIAITFSNRSEYPLPNLTKEDRAIYKLLTERADQGHFRIDRDSHATVASVRETLINYREELIVFHYSGHSNGNHIFLQDQPGSGKGLTQLLSQCPKLRLVVLNGCFSRQLVPELLDKKPSLVIVATEAPIPDAAATEFSIGFYQAFSRFNQSIGKSFEAGLGAAQLLSKEKIAVSRGLFRSSSEKQPLWGLFYKSEPRLDWRLPQGVRQIRFSDADEPNVHLVEQLTLAFAKYDKYVASKTEASFNRKRSAILLALPLPVSEQLRKLFAIRKPGEGAQIFFDQLGHHRLRQLVITYQTVAELLLFAHLAQLWDVVVKQQKNDIPKPYHQALISFFFAARNERKNYLYFQLIGFINELFDRFGVTNFLSEFSEVSEALQPGTELDQAISFFHRVNRMILEADGGTITVEEVIPLCIEAEKKLAVIFTHFAFLANYKMTSVKSIGWFRYRHQELPSFKLTMVELAPPRENFQDLEEKTESRSEALHNSSVYLSRTDRAEDHLNLTPFVIDQHAFGQPKQRNAPLTKICYFSIYEREIDVYNFKHVYHPDYNPIEIEGKDRFQVIKEQFEDFIKNVLQYSA